MQGLSSKGPQCSPCLRPQTAGFGLKSGAVGGITQNWVSDMGEVHPDLVGTPCFESTCEEASDRLAVRPKKALQDLPMGNGRAAASTHGLLVARVRVAVERGVNCPLRAFRCAPHQGEVSALEWPFSLFGELLAKTPVGLVGLGHDHQACRVLIQTMDDAWPPDPADARQACAAVGDECVDERSRRVARSR